MRRGSFGIVALGVLGLVSLESRAWAAPRKKHPRVRPHPTGAVVVDQVAAHPTEGPANVDEPASTPSASTPPPAPPEPVPPSHALEIFPAPQRDAATRVAARGEDAPRIDVAAGIELALRDFRYNDRITTNLRTYEVIGAPLASVAIDLAPFAGDGGPVLSRLGVLAGYASSVGLSSKVGGAELPTSWSHFYVGPRFRMNVARAPRVDVGASVTYSGETVSFAGAFGAITSELPAVAYRDVRSGLDARIAFGRVSIVARAGYDYVLSAGDVAERTPDTSVAGIDASLGAGVALGYGLELRASTSYQRFFYAFHPQPGATFVAGGAVDQMGTVGVALAWAR